MRLVPAARLLLALLAFAGSQASFALAAFRPAPRLSTTHVWQAGTDGHSAVDAARLPIRNARRAVTSGPSDPSRYALIDWLTIRQLAIRAHSADVPESFVPPPPFHPPRAL